MSGSSLFTPVLLRTHSFTATQTPVGMKITECQLASTELQRVDAATEKERLYRRSIDGMMERGMATREVEVDWLHVQILSTVTVTVA